MKEVSIFLFKFLVSGMISLIAAFICVIFISMVENLYLNIILGIVGGAFSFFAGVILYLFLDEELG